MFRKERLNFVVRKFKACREIKGTMRSFCVFDLRCFFVIGFYVFFLLWMMLQFKEWKVKKEVNAFNIDEIYIDLGK